MIVGRVNNRVQTEFVVNARQIAAITTAFMLPLSTSGEAIGVSVFAILAVITLDRSQFKQVLARAPAWLPVVLFGIILVGVLWSMLPLTLAMKWVGPYAKLLLIPLVMANSFSVRQARQIGLGFLIACLILLCLSWASFLWPSGPWGWFSLPGVPVKDNAVQSECFALSAFGLVLAAIEFRQEKHYKLMSACVVVALLFFSNLFVIYLSKTGVLVAFSLLGVFIIRLRNWRHGVLFFALALSVAVSTAMISSSAQRKLTEIATDIQATTPSSETVSTASRRDFWWKAYVFVLDAPIFGHGTGSIQPLYQQMEATAPSPYGQAVADPHNQFLHTVLQVGLVGGFILVTMWLVHFRLFLARDPVSLLGLAVVIQNVVGSLFNSHLSQVTQGMLYCLAVGLIGSLILNQNKLRSIS